MIGFFTSATTVSGQNTDHAFTFPNRENPHGKAHACVSCHSVAPNRLEDAGSGNLMESPCEQCHNTPAIDRSVHPLSGPTPSDEAVAVPHSFPLKDGRINCSACHDEPCSQTIDPANPMFLREGPYASTLDFCFRCHRDEYYPRYDPHLQLREDGTVKWETCYYCHLKIPALHEVYAGELSLTGPVEQLCIRCHEMSVNPGKNHIYHVKPGSPEFKRLQDSQARYHIVLPLEEGDRINCYTCHDPHERQVAGAKSVALFNEKRIRHRLRISSDFLCWSCHDQ